MKTHSIPILLAAGLCLFCDALVYSQTYTFTTIAGVAGSSGSSDGTNSGALFNFPTGIAVDGSGNLYVSDNLNRIIRKVTPSGANWVASTLAGLLKTTGSADGPNSDARFRSPNGIAVDSAGNVFVADSSNNTIRKLTPSGTNWIVSTIAGLAGSEGSADGTGTDARFKRPTGITFDNKGNCYVGDSGNNTIRHMVPEGNNWVVSTIAGLPGAFYGGFADGIGGAAQFNSPWCLAVRSVTNLYVTDWGNHSIREMVPAGTEWEVTTAAGFSGISGISDGIGAVAEFNFPAGIAADNAGNVFVADRDNHTIRKITFGTNGPVVTTIGGVPRAAGTNDGIGSHALFNKPWGIAVDSAGNLYVADYSSHTIRKGVLSQAPSIPSLQFATAGNQIILGWPGTATNYVLETTSTLSADAVWTALTSGVAVSGDAFVLTNDMAGSAGFFRLRKL